MFVIMCVEELVLSLSSNSMWICDTIYYQIKLNGINIGLIMVNLNPLNFTCYINLCI